MHFSAFWLRLAPAYSSLCTGCGDMLYREEGHTHYNRGIQNFSKTLTWLLRALQSVPWAFSSPPPFLEETFESPPSVSLVPVNTAGAAAVAWNLGWHSVFATICCGRINMKHRNHSQVTQFGSDLATLGTCFDKYQLLDMLFVDLCTFTKTAKVAGGVVNSGDCFMLSDLCSPVSPMQRCVHGKNYVSSSNARTD